VAGLVAEMVLELVLCWAVRLGQKCVATSMQLQHVVALLEGDRRWALRWDERTLTKRGFVAAILDHQGPESYLLVFSFAGSCVGPGGA